MKSTTLKQGYLVGLILALICLLVEFSQQQSMSTCPHLITSLTKLSTLPKWNVLDSQLVITSSVLVDKSPGVKLKSIIVASGGSLIFDDKNIDLSVEWIRVDSGANFVMGSEACPINNKLKVSFVGNRTTSNIIGSDPYDNASGGY